MPAIRLKKNRVLVPGPVLIGFGDVFDASYGDPRTPRPYPKVTPSRVGNVLLPFPCPHCGAIRTAVIDPKTRNTYRDADRGFSWCPSCQKRFIIDPAGTPLTKALPAGATYAPALVDRGGKVETSTDPVKDSLSLLGAI
jgi:hypothetical protein